jgi:gluconate 5-dehydrogenase
MAELALKTFGKIDILINSAGINIRGPIDELSLNDFTSVMDVNVTGTWLASRAVVPHMKKSGGGKIINLASTLGLVGLSNRTLMRPVRELLCR